MNFLIPSKAYLTLAIHEPSLITLWVKADDINRRCGNRKWDQFWYGFGTVPFGFKERMIKLVGIRASADAHPLLKTTTAYSTVYQELVAVLQRSRRVTAASNAWHPPSTGPVDLSDDAAAAEYRRTHGYDLNAIAASLATTEVR